MQFLHNWIVTMVAAVLITNLLEMLLPESKLQKFVRVILGIFIIVTILHPLLLLVHQNIKFEHLMLKASGQGMESVEEIMAKGNALKKVSSGLAEQQYAEGLTRQVRSLALLVNGVADAKAQVSLDKKIEEGKIEKVEIFLKTKGIFAEKGVALVPPVHIAVKEKNVNPEKEKKNQNNERMKRAVEETVVNFYNLKSKQVVAYIVD